MVWIEEYEKKRKIMGMTQGTRKGNRAEDKKKVEVLKSEEKLRGSWEARRAGFFFVCEGGRKERERELLWKVVAVEKKKTKKRERK